MHDQFPDIFTIPLAIEWRSDPANGPVSNIPSRLHLADRPQTAVYAWQQGIVQRNSVEEK